MNRAEIIHRAALIYVDTMSEKEVTDHVYKSAVFSMEKLEDESLVTAIREYFPSVVQYIKEDKEDG